VPRRKVVRTTNKRKNRDEGPAFIPMQDDRLEQHSSTMDYYMKLADVALFRAPKLVKGKNEEEKE
jgi:hypothetical protein